MSGVQPRTDQVAALARLMAAFAIHERVQLVMACGSGKTLISRWHAEASSARRVVVFAPSRPLLAQLAREWRRVSSPQWRFDALVVCSDPATPAGIVEVAADDGFEPDWQAVRARATTDPARVARFLRAPRPGRAQVVFATYHSAPTVAEAIAATGTVFDLCVADEAHRLAGTPGEAFRQVLDGRRIVAKRRLFMTATPKLSSAVDGYSMDDPTVFGPVAHQVSFGQAITAGLLCDYEVHVLTAAAGTDETSASPAAVLDAASRLGCSSILSFHGRVAKAAAFAATIDKAATRDGRIIQARCLSGAVPAAERDQVLRWFGEREPGRVKVVTNARLLGEGIDVPAIDAICFSDQRSSVIDIVQAIGRVLRPHPDKKIAKILVPVSLPEGADDDTELALSRYRVLWTVLRALRAHDSRFAVDVDQAARETGSRNGLTRRRAGVPQVTFHLPGWGPDEETVWLRLVSEVSDVWEQYYAACLEWGWRNPGRRMQHATCAADGRQIGAWAAKQRRAYSAGMLTAQRAELLQQVPGWFWDADAAAFTETIGKLQAFADAHGTVEEAATGTSRFDGLYSSSGVGRPERLWLWLARQRQEYRQGSLPVARQQQLEALPGWAWTPVPAGDLRMVDALAQFVAFEHHAQVPDGHLEDGLPLGRWVWKVRKLKLWGTLPPALEAEILAATPSQWTKGVRVRWQWEKGEVQWRLGFTALRQYAAREGHANPTGNTREEFESHPIRIGAWVALQRHLNGKGELGERRQELLERLPGWVWRGDVGGTREAGDPIELPGTIAHGSAGAVRRGCPCQVCLDGRREWERGYLAAKRAQFDKEGVPAGAARLQLKRLEVAVAAQLNVTGYKSSSGRTLIAHTAGVPLGELRRIAAGARRVQAETRQRLLATTVEMCLRNVDASGTRGRLNQRGMARVDAAPTLRLVADLEGRGFNKGWIGRELGYRGSLQLAGDQCTKAMADRIAELHRQVGDLIPPDVSRVPGIPPLQALLKSRPTGRAAAASEHPAGHRNGETCPPSAGQLLRLTRRSPSTAEFELVKRGA